MSSLKTVPKVLSIKVIQSIMEVLNIQIKTIHCNYLQQWKLGAENYKENPNWFFQLSNVKTNKTGNFINYQNMKTKNQIF